MKWGKVQRNAAALADPPKETRPEILVWSPDQMATFLASLEGDRLAALWRLAVTTGMDTRRARRPSLGGRGP